MRYVLCAVVFLALSTGCKRTNNSEGKWAGRAAKQATNAGKLSDEIVAKITQAVKKSIDKGEVDDLKKLISEGGKVAEAAITAYRRSFTVKTDEWLNGMKKIDEKIKHLQEEIPLGEVAHKQNRAAFYEEIMKAEELTVNFLEVLKRRLPQVNELADDNYKVADGLCCESINFRLLERSFTKLPDDKGDLLEVGFTRIRNILKAEQDFLTELRSKPQPVDKASKNVSETTDPTIATATATRQLSDDVQKKIINASEDADFVHARLAIEEGIESGNVSELRVALDDLLASNPDKVNQFYRSYTNFQFFKIERALSKTIPEITDHQGLYRALDELLEDTKQLFRGLAERSAMFKQIIDEDKLKTLYANNSRYMVDDSTLKRLPLSRRNSNLHWLEQLPKQIENTVTKRLAKLKPKLREIRGVRAEIHPRIDAIKQEVKNIKAICNEGLC